MRRGAGYAKMCGGGGSGSGRGGFRIGTVYLLLLWEMIYPGSKGGYQLGTRTARAVLQPGY